jgi:hypothetical protein
MPNWAKRGVTIVVVAPIVLTCLNDKLAAFVLVELLNIGTLIEYKINVCEPIQTKMAGKKMQRGARERTIDAAVLPCAGGLMGFSAFFGVASFAMGAFGAYLMILSKPLVQFAGNRLHKPRLTVLTGLLIRRQEG